MTNKVKIIQTDPLRADLFVDGLELQGVVSYQVTASCQGRQTLTIVMYADVEIENRVKDITT